MKINKILIYIILLMISGIYSAYSDDHDLNNIETNNNEEKKEINVDDEELPAIDPFQTSSGFGGASGGQIQDPNAGFLNGLKLIGVIIGETKKIAVLSGANGMAVNYEEEEDIIPGTTIVEIFNDHLLIRDQRNIFYEVFMNNVIKQKEG